MNTINKKTLSHFDILEAKKAYKEGRNVTELLRSQKRTTLNTPEIIETAYDLQAGSYIQNISNNPTQTSAYTTELAAILEEYNLKGKSLLDIGTGELTTISHITSKLNLKPKEIFAFDISWSRIYKGISYAKKIMGDDYQLLRPFVADIHEIPLLDKSVDVTTSSHALEPNGGKLKELLNELFRITIEKLVLFEPCFEVNTEEGRKRMEKLGYIKNIEGTIEALGGRLEKKIIIKNIINPLNPTVCFIITPPVYSKGIPFKNNHDSNVIFSVPGTDIPIREIDNYYFSNQVGLCYPILKSIPILKSNAAILASSLCDQTDSEMS